jgi:hypothetical protein
MALHVQVVTSKKCMSQRVPDIHLSERDRERECWMPAARTKDLYTIAPTVHLTFGKHLRPSVSLLNRPGKPPTIGFRFSIPAADQTPSMGAL